MNSAVVNLIKESILQALKQSEAFLQRIIGEKLILMKN